MIPRDHLATAPVPGGGELRLMRRGADFMIVLDRNELMSTRMRGSEEALASLAIAALANPAPQLLVGGYGMGFTLRRALALLGPHARVTVAELVPEIIEWAKGPMVELTAGCLDDRRVQLIIADVANVITGSRGQFDAILLDVDNGPDGLVRDDNGLIYSRNGLAAAHAALRPGGVLAVWSAAPDAAFARRMERAHFSVTEHTIRARETAEGRGKGPRHVVWMGKTRAERGLVG